MSERTKETVLTEVLRYADQLALSPFYKSGAFRVCVYCGVKHKVEGSPGRPQHRVDCLAFHLSGLLEELAALATDELLAKLDKLDAEEEPCTA